MPHRIFEKCKSKHKIPIVHGILFLVLKLLSRRYMNQKSWVMEVNYNGLMKIVTFHQVVIKRK